MKVEDFYPLLSGQRLHHAVFGSGTLIKFVDGGLGLQAEIIFDQSGTKLLVLYFAAPKFTLVK